MSFLIAMEQANEMRRQQLEEEEWELKRKSDELMYKRQILNEELANFENRLQRLSLNSSMTASHSSDGSVSSTRPLTMPVEYSNPEVAWAASDDEASSIYIGASAVSTAHSSIRQSGGPASVDVATASPARSAHDSDGDEDDAGSERGVPASVSSVSMLSSDAAIERHSEDSWSNIGSD
ncbi:hypothetical protein SYNPS1DRAFT_25457 [Syncephalis pseudoplumigaleata]|uniref:Uncharacterized protein n=1 Tax=Syncephalis pseudoplumigaleata TaxID=1712513 RepID=A0A4P9YSN6_9FUNG|nr:hypothetical protein SYNPS1DRAFT_25457 [Syncephalis pseudoplumigaleata]|eukprot:RKP22698.1 hypothetical protein SYNPS1DRAFT_25457 [Syncephalis pseudoplumigaleata]